MDFASLRKNFTQAQSEVPKAIYGSVQQTSYKGQDYTAVTYWMFYLNDPKHGGVTGYGFGHPTDLETVTVLLNESGPQYIAVSQHFGGEVREWEKTPKTGTHVQVYPAWGAHSNFLSDSSQYSSGIPLQCQFLQSDQGDLSVCHEVDVYVDRTGGGQVWRPGNSSASRDYTLIQLTGNEMWADYEKSLAPDDSGGTVPMQRARWTDPQAWLDRIPPDEKQLEADVEVAETTTTSGEISVEIDITNDGPKPHEFWVVVEAKPKDVSWNSDQVTEVGTRSVALPVEDTTDVFSPRTVDVEGKLPEDAASQLCNVRVRVLAYEPELVESEDRVAVDEGVPIVC